MREDYSLGIFKYINEFLASHDVSVSSRTTYKNALSQFSKWCKDSLIENPTRESLLLYKLWLDASPLSSFTKATYIVVIRLFFSWLSRNDIYDDVSSGIKGIKRLVKSHHKDSLSFEEIKILLSCIDCTTIIGKRDFSIINLLIRTGIRLKEVSGTLIEDIQMFEHEAKLWVRGKGRAGKDEFVVLTSQTINPIKKYLRERKPKGSQDPLFTSLSNRSFGKSLSIFSLSRMIKKRLRNSGIDSKRISAHSLRHTFGVMAIRAGASLYEVQLAMRHMAPSTTEVYLGDIEKIKRFEASPERKLSQLLDDV